MEFKELIHTLVEKAGAMGGAIQDLTLEQVGDWLEQLRDKKVEAAHSHESVESFNDLRDHFCKVLMESETMVPGVYSKKISELFPEPAGIDEKLHDYPDEATVLNEMLAPIEPNANFEDYSHNELHANEAPAEAPVPIWESFDAPILEETPPPHEEIHHEEIPPLDEIELPVIEETPVEEVAAQPADAHLEEDEAVTQFMQVPQAEETVVEEETPTQMMQMPPPPAPEKMPPMRTAPPVPEPTPVTQTVPAPDAPLQPVEIHTGIKFLSHEAEDRARMADYMTTVAPPSQVATGARHLHRLAAELLCSAVEIEANAVLAPKLAHFWSIRGQEVRPLLDDTTKRTDLHPELKKALDALASSDPDGLYDIPFASLSNALKFFLSLPSPDVLKPSLTECSTLFLLFGQNRKLDTLSLKNVLNIEGIEAAEITELSARLMRLSRWKVKTQNLWGEATTDWLAEVRPNVNRIMELLHLVKFGA